MKIPAALNPIYVGCTIIVTLMTGCETSMVTSRVEPKVPANWSSANGVPYYLPKGRIQIDGTWSKDTHEWLVKVSSLIEADQSCRFYLKQKKNYLFDDDLTFSVDSNQLLQTVNGTSADKTVSILGI
jgi:hypothetical protein